MTLDPSKGPNMSQRAVMQHLSMTDWKLAHRLPIPAGEMTLGRLVQQGWIETQGKDHKTVARLTEAGVKAMRSPISR
jgi:DNA-binding PadR family transcriptional regulator